MAAIQQVRQGALSHTSLDALHRELGARMVPFAGWNMPLQYQTGIVAEHLHTRAAASLFDVSHMGQAVLTGAAFVEIAAAFERLVPGDIAGLAPGAMRYTMLLNESGGVRDDIIVTRWRDGLGIVVNAACALDDFAHIATSLPEFDLSVRDNAALIALQGPEAAPVLTRILGDRVATMPFMSARQIDYDGVALTVSRSGYTGEDGFELCLAGAAAPEFARRLLAEAEVAPAGLGARDSLRLEAGLCLMGHDLDATTSPVEARLGWTVAKHRRAAGDFPGAERILRELDEGPARARVGLLPAGRAIVREGAAIMDSDENTIGRVTSGGFGPTVGGPVAMGYVTAAAAELGTRLLLEHRGVPVEARVVKLPFVPARPFRG
ncbi:MAG: glycine cleavage system aminomethyltransferase GcvT [Alphaproteobacteria bacterium]|nr:glycine cleavage system aminomethyltransferase GcvT [Alphaproteobacteria bacterium]